MNNLITSLNSITIPQYDKTHLIDPSFLDVICTNCYEIVNYLSIDEHSMHCVIKNGNCDSFCSEITFDDVNCRLYKLYNSLQDKKEMIIQTKDVYLKVFYNKLSEILYKIVLNNNSIIEPIISSKQSENDIKENEKVDNSKLPLLVNHKNKQNEFLKESSSFRETSPKKDLPLNTILNSKEEENKTPLVLTETQQLLNPIEKLIKEKENFIEPPFIRNKEEKININQSNLNKENLSNELTAIEKPRKSIKPSKSKDNITSTENKLKESLTDPKEKLENTFDNKKQKGNTNNSQEQISNENITIPITDTLKETTTSIQTNIPKINENNLNIIPINKKQIENENYKKLTDKEPVNKELSSPQT